MKPSTVEKYTRERKAEFLLSNATTKADYRKTRQAVRKLGLDPDKISQVKWTGWKANNKTR